MFQELHALVSQFVNLSHDERSAFESAFSFRQVPKKYKLAEKGKIASELFFIRKGILRLYYEKDGEEITGYIFREGLFAGSYESFLRRTPGIQTLETLEECELLAITANNLDMLYQSVPKVNILTRKIAEQRFINAQAILSSFILESPEERYKKFAAANGDLLLRVPHHIIASYLGITPVSMSRIRKRLSNPGG